MLSREENELLTRTGPGTPMGEVFRRFWLPALLPSELPEPDCPPVRVRLLSEDLVAFRDTSGRVGIIAANCPHRGASLFFGRNEEEGLRCVYHGWKFDIAGNCVDMPNEPPESNFKQKVKAIAYPAQEWGGMIWVYMGPSHLTPDLPQLEWALIPDSHRYIRKSILDANYLQGMEGDIDASHASFLHKWFSVADLPNQRSFPSNAVFTDGAPLLRVQPTDAGFIYGARRNAGDGSYHWRCTQWMVPTYSVLASRDGLRFGPARVPIDDERSWIYFIAFRADGPMTPDEIEYYESGATGKPRLIPGTFNPLANRSNDYLMDREMQRTKNYTGMWSSADQDLAVQESLGHIYDRTKEHLGTSDTAIIAARRILAKLARDLEGGVEPYAAQHGDVYRLRPLDSVEGEPEFGRYLEAHRQDALVPG